MHSCIAIIMLIFSAKQASGACCGSHDMKSTPNPKRISKQRTSSTANASKFITWKPPSSPSSRPIIYQALKSRPDPLTPGALHSSSVMFKEPAEAKLNLILGATLKLQDEVAKRLLPFRQQPKWLPLVRLFTEVSQTVSDNMETTQNQQPTKENWGT